MGHGLNGNWVWKECKREKKTRDRRCRHKDRDEREKSDCKKLGLLSAFKSLSIQTQLGKLPRKTNVALIFVDYGFKQPNLKKLKA